jgi:hypothetical protein
LLRPCRHDGAEAKEALVRRTLLILGLAACSVACILATTTHTLYLEDDGSVTWTVLQEDVRSDADSAAKRAAEEQGLLDAIAADEHPAAVALRSLGGGQVATTLLRDRRPFTIRTSGRFESIEALARALIEALEIPGSVRLSVADGVWTLDLELRLDEIEDQDGEDDDELHPVIDLVDDVEDYTLVAPSARFVRATGFAIEDNGRTVKFDLPSEEEILAGDKILTLSLSWKPESP